MESVESEDDKNGFKLYPSEPKTHSKVELY